MSNNQKQLDHSLEGDVLSQASDIENQFEGPADPEPSPTLEATPAKPARSLAAGLGWRRASPVADPASDEPEPVEEEPTDLEEAPALSPFFSDNLRDTAGIGRGGVTAIVLLLLFLPLLGGLAYLLLDANNQIDSLKRNVSTFAQNQQTQGSDSQFVTLLSESNLQTVNFKSEDGSPFGKVVLYAAGRLRWAVSYGKLDPLPPNQMYVMWLVQRPQPGRDNRYDLLTLMPDVKSSGNAIVLRETAFPPSFNVQNYSQLIVTIEPIERQADKPTGPRRFSLDLAQVNA